MVRQKALNKKEKDSVNRPKKEAEIQRKALRSGKNLDFSQDICTEKKRKRTAIIARKVG